MRYAEFMIMNVCVYMMMCKTHEPLKFTSEDCVWAHHERSKMQDERQYWPTGDFNVKLSHYQHRFSALSTQGRCTQMQWILCEPKRSVMSHLQARHTFNAFSQNCNIKVQWFVDDVNSSGHQQIPPKIDPAKSIFFIISSGIIPPMCVNTITLIFGMQFAGIYSSTSSLLQKPSIAHLLQVQGSSALIQPNSGGTNSVATFLERIRQRIYKS